MKIYLIIILLVSILTISATDLKISFNNNNVKITGDFSIKETKNINLKKEQFVQILINDGGRTGKSGEAELPVYSKLLSLPANGNYSVANLSYDFDEIDLAHKIAPFGWEDKINVKSDYYNKDGWFPKEIVGISKPNIMRGIRFTQVSVMAVQYNPKLQKIRVLKNIDIDLEIDESIKENPLKSVRKNITETFDKFAKSNIIGYNSPRTFQNGSYLFVVPDNIFETIQPLLRWKEKLGYKTYVATLSQTGSTSNQISNYIQNAYDTSDNPPEFVVLVGDVSGTYQMPAFYVDGYFTPQDVTDHTYTLLEGTDYFPDVLIGRLSVRSLTELQTVINKIIKYESTPYTQSNWIEHALMITYISEWGWDGPFMSARETKMGVREKLLDYEYSIVDTFFSPYQSSSSQLISKINEGYSFVNYRGAGGPGYWYEPFFNVNNVHQLNNGTQMPMVTSITCGGGDFAAYDYPECFGEAWLTIGTPSSPKGAIGFIGPSEHDTKTQFNNANDLGIYQGITQENLFRCGEMLLRGKMELYNCYPHCHDWGGALDSDQFYFYVYNLLGDPGLKIWTTTPQEISFNFSESISSSENYIEIQISEPMFNSDNFTIAITNSTGLITTVTTDELGYAVIPIDLIAGDYEVTASKYNFIPQTASFTVTAPTGIGMVNYTFDNELFSGETIELNTQFHNFNDETLTNLDFELVANDDLDFITSSVNISEILSCEDVNMDFSFQIPALWQNDKLVNLFLQINSIALVDTFVIPINLISPEVAFFEISVENTDNCLIQNENNEIWIELKNTGNYLSGDFQTILQTRKDNITINSENSAYNSIEVSETGQNITAFQVFVDEEVISGELAAFRLIIESDSETLQILDFDVPIGIISESSPTFCEYGYIAIESSDIGNFDAPVYDWIEIDPSNGGSGTQVGSDHSTCDGSVKVIDLPFDFKYFGENYNEISVSSEGWLAMGSTEIVYHRNRNIPSAEGPKAMIAPFWDDLENGDMYYFYDETENYFVVLWSDFKNTYNSSYHETFQCILYDPIHHQTLTGDGMIKFQYDEINNVDANDNYATIGIENETQSSGLLLSYSDIYAETAHEIEDNTAILFTTVLIPEVHTDDVVTNTLPSLFQNYPNPFNPVTTIRFSISNLTEKVDLSIFNLKGQKVKKLEISPERVREKLGIYEVVWNGTDDEGKKVSSGLFFYRLEAGDFVQIRKMLLLK
ncbi:MAG: hypothetical protein K8S23_05805 [Candidatus Cloacimonetes bacterium]|nr:hypothetical protein [Candidatus Cloacimonadota bacterium]